MSENVPWWKILVEYVSDWKIFFERVCLSAKRVLIHFPRKRLVYECASVWKIKSDYVPVCKIVSKRCYVWKGASLNDFVFVFRFSLIYQIVFLCECVIALLYLTLYPIVFIVKGCIEVRFCLKDCFVKIFI